MLVDMKPTKNLEPCDFSFVDSERVKFTVISILLTREPKQLEPFAAQHMSIIWKVQGTMILNILLI